MPPAWRPCVPTRVMKCSERRSIWRNSFRLSGSTVISGHHAPSPSSKSSLEEKEEAVKKKKKISSVQAGRWVGRGGGWKVNVERGKKVDGKNRVTVNYLRAKQ